MKNFRRSSGAEIRREGLVHLPGIRDICRRWRRKIFIGGWGRHGGSGYGVAWVERFQNLPAHIDGLPNAPYHQYAHDNPEQGVT